jgi:hypothetical protein
MKARNIILSVTILLACVSCRQDMADHADDSAETVTKRDVADHADDSAETVTNMSGTLSYYPDFGMWGISVSIAGTVDNADLYLIKEFKDLPSPETVARVTFSGKYYPSDKRSPVAGVEIFYIDITALNYEPDDSAETVTNMSGMLSYYPDFGMWGISVSIAGTVDNADLYLIKEFKDPPSPETVARVTFSGKYYPSDKKSPVAGVEIFYIDITDLTFGWCGSIWPGQEE